MLTNVHRDDAFARGGFQVVSDGLEASALGPPNAGVAVVAKKAADATSGMVVIYLEGRPFTSDKHSVSVRCGDLATDGASASLRFQHAQELVVANAIFPAQSIFSALEPISIPMGDTSGFCSHTSPDTDLAFRPVTLPTTIEFSGGLGFLADVTGNSIDIPNEWGNSVSRHIPDMVSVSSWSNGENASH